MGKRLLLIGGGGHCRSVLDSVMALNLYEAVGIVDNNSDSSCLGIPVIGNDEDIPALIKAGWNCAVITVGSVGDTKTRRRLYEMVKGFGLYTPTVVDPTATIAGGTTIDEGCFIGKRAIVNTGSVIGRCSIINTGAIVEHDCTVGEFTHISTGAVLCGEVRVGRNTHLGAGSVVKQRVTIGDSVLIGVGSVVVKDILEQGTAYGNPCRVVK